MMKSNEKFDPTKPAQTRDGRPVRIIDTEFYGDGHSIVAAILNVETGTEIIMSFFSNGRSQRYGESWCDLVNVPEKHVRYINIYESDLDLLSLTKTEADSSTNIVEEAINSRRIACVRIEFKEGDGLE